MRKFRNPEFVKDLRVKVEFVKAEYKSHKIIKLYATVRIMGNCSANRKELEDPSAIKGKFDQIRPIRVSHLGILESKT